MVSNQSKQAPKKEIVECTDRMDARNFTKASLRLKALVANHGIPKGKAEPVRIPASKNGSTEILPSPFNRLGRSLNLMYIHKDLGLNIEKEGWQELRPTPGFVVRRTKSDTLKRLHEHNRALHANYGNLLPPLSITPTSNKECLGGNHLTMTIRMFGSDGSYTSPITGQVFKVPADDTSLAIIVGVGHHYYELDDDITDDDCKFISEILNSDQQQNQSNSEDHLRNMIAEAIGKLVTVQRPTCTTTDVISAVMKESVVKLRPDQVGDMAGYVMQFHNSPYIRELTNWYAENVNPRELTVSSRWFMEIAKAWGKDRPLTKLGATFVQYRGLTVLSQPRPNPDLSRTIDAPMLNSLAAKHVQNLDETESFLRNNRTSFEEYLADKIGREAGVRSIHWLEEAAVRLLTSKAMNGLKFEHKVSGKWTEQKMSDLQRAWMTHMKNMSPALANIYTDMAMEETSGEGGSEVDSGEVAHNII